MLTRRFAFAVLVYAAAAGSAACSGISLEDEETAPNAEGHCGLNETVCGATCVDTETSSEHCGGCGNRCVDGRTCTEGICSVGCSPPQTRCLSGCADLLSDAANCGACGLSCSTGANATGQCDAGTCVVTCVDPFRDCNHDLGDGCEHDITSDPANCGACDESCLAFPRAAPNCVQGACSIGPCIADFGDCDGGVANGCETSLLSNGTHCGGCGQPCGSPAQFRCMSGQCEALRPNILQCGSSFQDITAFFPFLAPITLVVSCTPDADTQAMFVTRSGTSSLVADLVKSYVQAGGIVITEQGNADDVFSMVFSPVSQGTFNGSCADNLALVVQKSPQDPLWADNDFVPLVPGQTGCGFDVSHFPNIVPLGGWTTSTVSLAYRDLGEGRVWLVEADWQDGGFLINTQTEILMSYMTVQR